MCLLSFGLVLLVIVRSLAILDFSPSGFIEFINSPTLIPGQKSFTITNYYDRIVQINNVDLDSSHFHTMLFEPTMLQPLQELSIQIFFIPYYSTETLESILTIETSEGDIQYPARGRAIPNPYRIRPFWIKLQRDNLYHDRPIVIFNPHKETIYIKEIYSLEDFISFKGGPTLDPGATVCEGDDYVLMDSDSSKWIAVDPGLEKEISVLSIMASKSGWFSGYIHLKTSLDHMLIPVEVQILDSSTSLKPREDLIDFGHLTGLGQKSYVDLWVQNMEDHHLVISHIVLEVPESSVKIIPTSEKTIADKGSEFLIAQLVYTAELSLESVGNSVLVVFSDIDIMSSRSASSVLRIPFTASVVLGGIILEESMGIEESQSTFVLPPLQDEAEEENDISQSVTSPTVAENDFTVKDFYLINSFPLPIRLLSISTSSCEDVFSISAPFLENPSSRNNGPSNSCVANKKYSSENQNVKLKRTDFNDSKDSFSPLSVALSNHRWPPITVTFNKKIAARQSRMGMGMGTLGDDPHASPQHTIDGAPLIPHTPSTFIPYTCWLDVHSNKSSHRLPLYIIDGTVRLTYMNAAPLRISPPLPKCAGASDESKRKNAFPMTTGTASVYNIDIGVIAAHEPGAFKFSLSNYNPVPISLYLQSANRPMCVCSDISWPIGRDDEALAKQIIWDMIYGDTMFPALAYSGDKRCQCGAGDGIGVWPRGREGEDSCFHSEGQLKEHKEAFNKATLALGNSESDAWGCEGDIDGVAHSGFQRSIVGSLDDEEGMNDYDNDSDTDLEIAFNALENPSEDDAFFAEETAIYIENLEDDDEKSPDASGSRVDDGTISKVETTIEGEAIVGEEEVYATEEERKLASLNKRMSELVALRDKLYIRKAELEEERKKTLSRRIENVRIALTSYLDRIDAEQDKHDSADAASKKDFIDGTDGAISQSQTEAASKTLKYLQHRTLPPGSTMRSFGLLHRCGRDALGAARAGYNSLFQVNLAPFLIEKFTGLKWDTATVKMSTPYRDITLALHYCLTSDVLKSSTHSDFTLHEVTATSIPLYIGGSPSSATVTTSLANGELTKAWRNIVEERKSAAKLAASRQKEKMSNRRKSDFDWTSEDGDSSGDNMSYSEDGSGSGLDDKDYVTLVVEEDVINIAISSDKYFLSSYYINGDPSNGDGKEKGNEDGAGVKWRTLITPVSICDFFGTTKNTKEDKDTVKEKDLDSEEEEDEREGDKNPEPPPILRPHHTMTSLPLSRFQIPVTQNKTNTLAAEVRSEIADLIIESSVPLPSLFTCTRNILTHYPSVGALEQARCEWMVTVASSIQAHLSYGRVERAHDLLLQAQHKWITTFPTGIPLPNVDLVIHAPGTLHRHTVTGLTIESPLTLFPRDNLVSLPPVKPGSIIVFYIRVTNIFTVPVSFALQKGESKMKDKAGFGTRTKSKTGGENVKSSNGNGIDKEGPFAYVETLNDDKDEDESRLLLDEGAVWHEWFKQNCYYKSPATNVKNDMCPLSYQNMDNRTLWYNWYSLHHLTHRSNSTFAPSFPEFADHATLMRKNHKADTIGNSILTSQIIKGVETNIYSDKHQKFFASMELDEGPFYVHPFSQPDYGEAVSDDGVFSEEFTTDGDPLEPQGTMLLGPILFSPYVYNSEPGAHTYEDTLYVINSFSGVDKITIKGVVDLPAINIKSVAVISSQPSVSHFTFPPTDILRRPAEQSNVMTLTQTQKYKRSLQERYPAHSIFSTSDVVSQVKGFDVRTQLFHSVRIDRTQYLAADFEVHVALYFGSIIEVDLPDDRIVINLSNEGLTDATITHASWDEEVCSVEEPGWSFFAFRKFYFNRRVFFLCNDIQLPRVMKGSLVRPVEPSTEQGSERATHTHITGEGNATDSWEISFSVRDFLGDCIFEKRQTKLDLLISTKEGATTGERPKNSVTLHLSARLSEARRLECFRIIDGIPILGISGKGENVEKWLFILSLLFTIVWGMNTITSSLIEMGKQMKKRRGILALIKRDAKQSATSEIDDPLSLHAGARPTARVPRPAPLLSSHKRSIYLHAGINMQDIHTGYAYASGPEPPLHLANVEALIELRARPKEKKPAKALSAEKATRVTPLGCSSSSKRADGLLKSEKRPRPVSTGSIKKEKPERKIVEVDIAPEPAIKILDTNASTGPAITVDGQEEVIELGVKKEKDTSDFPVTPSLTPVKSNSNFHREDNEGGAFSSMFQPTLSSSSRNESLWRSLDDNELQRSGAEVELIVDRKDFESKKSILKDLSWASTASPLTPDIIFASSYQASTPSFPLPHLSSLDEVDDDNLTTFSPRTTDPYPSTVYNLESSLDIDDISYLNHNRYPSNLNYPGEIIFSDIEDFMKPSFSSNYFPSENNISGKIAIDLLSRDELQDEGTGSWGQDLDTLGLHDMTGHSRTFSDLNNHRDNDSSNNDNSNSNGNDSISRNGSAGKRVSIIDNHSSFTKDVISRLNNNIIINTNTDTSTSVSANAMKVMEDSQIKNNGNGNGNGNGNSHTDSNSNRNGSSNINDIGLGISGAQGLYFGSAQLNPDLTIRRQMPTMTPITTLQDTITNTNAGTRMPNMYAGSNGDGTMSIDKDNSSIIQSIDRLNRLGRRSSNPTPGLGPEDGGGSFYGDRELFSESDAWLQRLNLPQQSLFQGSNYNSLQSTLFDPTVTTTAISTTPSSMGTGAGTGMGRSPNSSRRRQGLESNFDQYYGDDNDNENENENEIGENDDWLQDISSWGLGRLTADHDYSVAEDSPMLILYNTNSMMHNTGMESSSGRSLQENYQSYDRHQVSDNHHDNEFVPSSSYLDNSMSYEAQHRLQPYRQGHGQRQEQPDLQRAQQHQQQLHQQHHLDMQQLDLEQERILFNPLSQQQRHQHQQQQHQQQQLYQQQQQQLEQVLKPKSNVAPPPGFEARLR